MMKTRSLLVLALACCLSGCATSTFTERQDQAIRDELKSITTGVNFEQAPYADVIAFINAVVEANWTSSELPRPPVVVLLQSRPIRMGSSTLGLETEAQDLIASFRARYEKDSDALPKVTMKAKQIDVWSMLEVISYSIADMNCCVAGSGVVLVRRGVYECQAYRIAPWVLSSQRHSIEELGFGADRRIDLGPERDIDSRQMAKLSSESGTVLVVATPFQHEMLQINPDKKLELRTANQASIGAGAPQPER